MEKLAQMVESDKEIHIWLILDLYPPNMSGAAIQAHQIIRELVRHKFSATILTSGNHAAASIRGQRTRRDGIEIRYLRTFRHELWASVMEVRRVRKVAPYIKALLGTLSFGILTAWTLWRNGQPGDIVRVYSPNEFSFLPVWMAKLKGMHPVLDMTLLGSDDPMAIKEHWNKLLGLLRLESFRRTEAITGHSSAQVQSYLSAGLDPRKVFQIPCGVDLSIFRQVNGLERIQIRKKLGLRPEGSFIVFIGDATARKGLDVLIAAFLEVHSQIADTELLIVGSCDFEDPAYSMAEGLKNELEEANLASFVHWIGMVDNVHEYMNASDVFCLPTRQEGFGIVIIEAMAAGLPAVVARLKGVTTDIITSDREGMLIDEHNSGNYAGALLQLLSDPSEARIIGERARERVGREFSLERVAGLYEQLYLELCGRAPQQAMTPDALKITSSDPMPAENLGQGPSS